MSTILLVEDNPMNLDMLSRRLKRRGYEVLVAMDGAEGVESAKAHRPDLILMDISLPVMDGYEATRILKANEVTRSIPILGLSAHAMSGDAEKALRAGCDGYDTKPVDMRRLLAKVEALLQNPPTEPVPKKPDAEQSSDTTVADVAPSVGETSVRSTPTPPEPKVDTATTIPLARTDLQEESTKGHVLLVIGDAERRHLLGDQLEGLGYSYENVNLAGGEAAIHQRVAARSFSALFLDHQTPHIHAERLVRSLRLEAISRELPIMLVSSVQGLESAFKVIQQGADFFLPFPVSNHQLANRLESVRNRRR